MSEKIGGKNFIVEIDESNFGKYRKPDWVFGGFEVGTGRIFLIRVEKR